MFVKKLGMKQNLLSNEKRVEREEEMGYIYLQDKYLSDKSLSYNSYTLQQIKKDPAEQ